MVCEMRFVRWLILKVVAVKPRIFISSNADKSGKGIIAQHSAGMVSRSGVLRKVEPGSLSGVNPVT